jgi:hypothetical protein
VRRIPNANSPPLPCRFQKFQLFTNVPIHVSNQRDAKWTQSIAVGDEEFVMETKAKLGAKAIGRRKMKNIEGYELRDSQNPYNRVFDPEKCGLRLKTDHIWQDS